MIAAVLATCVIFGVFIPWARHMDNLVKPNDEHDNN